MFKQILNFVLSFLNKKEEKKEKSFVEVFRYSDNGESTLGLMFIDNKFSCYVLEDEKRTLKIKGETRIPAGTYEIKFRNVGSFHDKYKIRFKDIYKGMLHIVGVPNFEYILIHSGNTDEDTMGCLLVGNKANNNNLEDGLIENSNLAFRYIYPKIADKLKEERVFITIKDEWS